jgi:hypothetical protein
MFDIWKHAKEITNNLAEGLYILELPDGGTRFSDFSESIIKASISNAWHLVIEQAQKGDVNLTEEYLSSLHKMLADPIGASSPGVFSNNGDNGEWTLFVDECGLDEDLNNDISSCDAWILAQLFWGNHVKSMAMSLAWLCINGLRLQEGLFAIYPSADKNERLLIALEGAGPDCWDAEDLRGFSGYYERDQKPEGY